MKIELGPPCEELTTPVMDMSVTADPSWERLEKRLRAMERRITALERTADRKLKNEATQ